MVCDKYARLPCQTLLDTIKEDVPPDMEVNGGERVIKQVHI
jgi:hypothetical protein